MNITTLLTLLLLTATTACAMPSGITRLGFAIQMGAFSELKNAERFTTRLQSKGIEAFYFRKDNGMYAVRFGDFPTKEKARKVAEKLVSEKLINTYYISLPQEIVFSRHREPAWQRPQPPEVKQPKPYQAVKQPQPDIPPQPRPTIAPDNSKQDQKPPASAGNRNMGAIAARTAERFVGIPYRWGGENVVDGMDCSGFARAVYNLCGVNIPRTSRDQFKAGEPVAREDLKDGDLVFFGASEDKINHVGIYVGDGKFVHAPRRGEEIKISSVEENYFERRFIGARRYFPQEASWH